MNVEEKIEKLREQIKSDDEFIKARQKKRRERGKKLAELEAEAKRKANEENLQTCAEIVQEMQNTFPELKGATKEHHMEFVRRLAHDMGNYPQP